MSAKESVGYFCEAYWQCLYLCVDLYKYFCPDLQKQSGKTGVIKTSAY